MKMIVGKHDAHALCFFVRAAVAALPPLRPVCCRCSPAGPPAAAAPPPRCHRCFSSSLAAYLHVRWDDDDGADGGLRGGLMRWRWILVGCCFCRGAFAAVPPAPPRGGLGLAGAPARVRSFSAGAAFLFSSTFKKRAPRALQAIRDFARKTMGTEDVRIDTLLNKFLWSKVRTSDTNTESMPSRMQTTGERTGHQH